MPIRASSYSDELVQTAVSYCFQIFALVLSTLLLLLLKSVFEYGSERDY